MLATYLRRFQKLRVARTARHGEAPYKPALLLAVLDGIADGSIRDNRIEITPELIAAFTAICTDLSTGSHFTAANFALPFYHLTGDGFWHLHTWPGLELLLTASNSVRSFRHLREVVAFAALDADLWQLAQQPEARAALQQALLARYFPATQARCRPRAGEAALAQIRRQILEEPAALYRTHFQPANELDQTMRNALFKREVLRAYDHTCAVSGLHLVSTASSPYPLLDACHIVPWALTHDDTLPNGLALCPNLHRAFDRHLFWIDADYRVCVAATFQELGGAAHGIRRFEGQELRLPREPAWWPGRENLRAQRGY
ncbi:HNH endonuclease [Hymenobacter armeniacus]|uniref:HNH endonuclease n=1 Tax=Hymenobacter armeniacus TaxID=2771358 RepID=A0ABR8JWB0_9BACT|nr:HNH endonuclease [Hymenobacter armeniacus]MBD2722822.1 HNH endonuclease [Hymenobacter armeniacus]